MGLRESVRAEACAVVALLLVACEDERARKPRPALPEPSAFAVRTPDARGYYAERCAHCHGASGRGDGASARTLTPSPRDYSEKAWQKSVTDEELRTAIVRGGPAVGKSAIMPASPDLATKPELIAGLVELIRGFGR